MAFRGAKAAHLRAERPALQASVLALRASVMAFPATSQPLTARRFRAVRHVIL